MPNTCSASNGGCYRRRMLHCFCFGPLLGALRGPDIIGKKPRLDSPKPLASVVNEEIASLLTGAT